jgi:SAM-dependent methyltransferase
MFLELHVSGMRREDLSWILCKHPDRTFELKMGCGRVVRGQWVLDSSENDDQAAYKLMVDTTHENNGVAFLQEMRKRNKSFYVNVCQSAVSPFTIVCIRDSLKNALKGNHGPEARARDKPLACSAILGPWAVPLPMMTQFLDALGLQVTPQSDDVSGVGKNKCSANVVRIASTTPITVTHFLQKLYVGATLLTHKQHVGDRWEWQQKLDALAQYTVQWQDCLAKLPPWAKRLISATQLTQDQLHSQKVAKSGSNLGLHERRHAWILDTLRATFPDGMVSAGQVKTVVDYGCANGQLSKLLLKTWSKSEMRLFASDVTREEAAARTWRQPALSNATFVRANLLYPARLLELLLENPDIVQIDALVLTEVIEHLEPKGREDLVHVIVDTLRPRHVLITTPNRAYNVHIPVLCGNGWRHHDHRIEYDQDEWEREVVAPFRAAGYTYTPANPWASEAGVPALSPSFCGHFVLDSDESGIRDTWREAHRRLRDTIFGKLKIIGMDKSTVVSPSTLAAGVMTPEFVTSADFVFYRAPTLAPVEHHAGEPDFLEHPLGAYDYYRQRGIQALWAEHKYMGSRAHMLIFANPAAAARANWHKPLLTILSRSGREFFSCSKAPNAAGVSLPGGSALPDVPPAWQPFLQARLEEQGLDFAMLDAEILPWSLKADRLIDQEFRQPGECALASRRYLFGDDSDKTQRAQLFLDTLACYTQEVKSHADVQARVFNVIACGHIDDEHGYTNVRYGDTLVSHERYALIDALCQGGDSVGLLPVQRMFVDLNDPASQDACTRAWLTYTALPGPGSEGQGGEGMVFKTHPTLSELCRPVGDTVPSRQAGTKSLSEKHGETSAKLTTQANAALVQPALKARGRDYLRLIYGIDYLMPECFAVVKHRRVALKRLLALKQTQLGRMILEAFLACNALECARCQAAFCGEGHCCVVDATL